MDEEAPPGRAPSNLVNPLLLVTERKGTAFSLHYGAFPLEAFHTEGSVNIAVYARTSFKQHEDVLYLVLL